MENNSVCGSDNLPNDAENTNLNEATPAVAPVLNSDLSKDASSILTDAVECDDAISSTTPDKFSDLETTPSNLINIEGPTISSETDADFFTSELSISDVPAEKITENVEDIVQDLENLLGESDNNYRFPRESFDSSKLAESYNEVNSSNVEDLVQESNLYDVQPSIHEISMQSPSLDCDILPTANIKSVELKETQINEPFVLEIQKATEEIGDSLVSKTTEEVNIVLESQVKDVEEINTDINITPNSPVETEELGNVVEDNFVCKQNLQPDEANNTINQEGVQKPEREVIEIDTFVNVDISNNEVCQDLSTEISTKSEVTDAGVILGRSSDDVSLDVNTDKSTRSEVAEVFADTEMTEVPEDSKAPEIFADSEAIETCEDSDATEVCADSEVTEICADSEMTKICGNSGATEVSTNSEVDELEITSNLPEIVSVSAAPDENATELFEELIKDSSEDECSVNLLKDASNGNSLKNTNIEDEKQYTEQEEAVLVVTDNKTGQPFSPVVTEGAVSDDTLTSSTEVIQKISEPLQNLMQDASEDIFVGNVEPFNKTDESVQQVCEVKLHDDIVSVDQNAEAGEELDEGIKKINKGTEKSFKATEEEVTTTRSTELVQPLTVEVEDPDFNEPELMEGNAHEQSMDKTVINEETEKTEVLESKNELKQTLPVDLHDNQVNRAPLKMTIAKYKSDNIHSILKIYDPNDVESNQEQHIPKLIIKSTSSSTTSSEHPEQVASTSEEPAIPKITIRSVLAPAESQHSPRLTIKPIKPPITSQEAGEKQISPKTSIKSSTSGTGSPRITIKPIVKPESLSPIKLTIRPYPKLEESQSSPKLNIKPIVKPLDETVSTESHHSPKITIKPIVKPPDEVHSYSEERHSPRITIKPVVKPLEEFAKEEIQEERHSPRITIKPIIKPEEVVKEEIHSFIEERHSPRITIKPLIKPPEGEIQNYSEEKHSPRITIKPIIKPPEESVREEIQSYTEERHSPRITIKPIVKPPEEEIQSHSEERHSPRITIKPVIKPLEDSIKDEIQSYSEERHSPRITIKPVIKPEELIKSEAAEIVHSPRITIKPIVKPQEGPEKSDEISGPPVQPFKLNIKPVVKPAECSLSPKVTIKPVPRPSDPDSEAVELIDFEEQIKQERIVLKIAKTAKKEKAPLEMEKLKKIKLKLSKERGLAHIVPVTHESSGSLKRSSSERIEQESKHFKTDLPSDLTISLISSTTSTTSTPDITITRVDSTISMLKENTKQYRQDDSGSSSNVKLVSSTPFQDEKPSFLEKISSSVTMEDIPDPLADIPVFEITLETAATMSTTLTKATTSVAPTGGVLPPAPRKRGRPRKVPLEVREEFKDPKEEETPPPVVEESTRPKRSCRGASVKATLGIKPRKPRAPSTRGRGSKRTVSTRASTAKKSKERKPSAAKLKLLKDSMIKEQSEFKEYDTKDAEFKQVPLPAELGNREVVIYEEETRMSAENSSRAQTPAKQVLTSSGEVVIEESQSSVQSNTTTESGEKTQKARKGPRLEVHQEPEGEVISADKLAEYSWGGGGPYMLQEQVAQFLGIKSFKRKYPGIQRRPVDMQERDFIRESCLASEAMCDMGLTAVRSEDILDIMYTDFQPKYEEYCKHQRDRQAKDVSNKQKALSLAASQEKNKLDIVEQAVQSAFQWNASFNKARREQRRACMDLQTFTVHFPKGKMKQVNKPSMGHYPLTLVPGQYTDYYKKYTPLELGNLPLNTTGCKTVSISSVNQDTEESQSDGSGSDSDSSSSDSDSSCSGSSGAEDCKMCSPAAVSGKKLLVH